MNSPKSFFQFLPFTPSFLTLPTFLLSPFPILPSLLPLFPLPLSLPSSLPHLHPSLPPSFPHLPHLPHLPSPHLPSTFQTVGYDPLVPAEEASQFGVEFMELDQIWPIADFVTLHVPLIPPTKGEQPAYLPCMHITNSPVRH